MRFSADEDFARQLDHEDPLRDFREKFSLPLGKGGEPVIYFAGNSLGLMPKSARQILDDELDNWARLGVDAHHVTGTPWYSYHEAVRQHLTLDDETFQRGLASAQRLRRWLHQTFPDAGPHPEKN